MISSRRERLSAITLLSFLLVVLLIWYGALEPAPSAGAYPGNEALAENYEQYHGQLVSVSGNVDTVDPLVIEDTVGGDELRLTVVDVDKVVKEGEQLRVYGVAREGRVIESRTAFTVPSSGLWYAYSVSFLGGLWVLGRLVNQWAFDPRNWCLNRRATRVRIRPLLRHWLARLRPGGDRDA